MSRLLLIDDDTAVLAALQRALRQSGALAGLEVEAYSDPFAALARICVHDFDVVVCDFHMPQMRGSELLQALKDVAPATVRIMLSGSTAFGTALSAINEAQVFRFLPKPWDTQQLEQQLLDALAQRAELLDEMARRPAPDAALTPQEREAAQLELEEPGLLEVRRAPDGGIIL